MKNKKVYIRLIITYLIVFLIPLVLNVFTLEEIARSTQDSICQGILVNMEHAGEILDNNFEELDAIVQKLTGNSTVRYIATQMEKRINILISPSCCPYRIIWSPCGCRPLWRNIICFSIIRT